MIYEEHGLIGSIAYESAIKKAGIEITLQTAPLEITTDTICIVDTTKHDEKIRADERAKLLVPYDVESIEELIQNVRAKAIEEFARRVNLKFVELPLDDLIVLDILKDINGVAGQIKGAQNDQTERYS